MSAEASTRTKDVAARSPLIRGESNDRLGIHLHMNDGERGAP